MAGGPKVAILGAGSVGCFIGAAWAAAGVPVTFVGRAKLAADIAEHGLTVSDYTGWKAHLPPEAVDYRCEPQALQDGQLIAVTVKSGDTAEAAAQIAEHGTQGATVISFQNGVSNVDVLEQALGGRFEIARGITPYNVAYLGQGRFHKGVAGDLYVEQRAGVRALADAVGRGPAAVKFSDDMLGLAWGKLLINLNNAVNALSGRTLIEQLHERDYRRVVAACQREGLALLKRAGIVPAKVGAVGPDLLPWVIGSPDWLFRNIFMKSWKIDARARSSMADDLAAGRTTEVDYINGELVKLAERMGTGARLNSRIVELIHNAEGGAPPLAPPELRREVFGR